MQRGRPHDGVEPRGCGLTKCEHNGASQLYPRFSTPLRKGTACSKGDGVTIDRIAFGGQHLWCVAIRRGKVKGHG